MTDDNRVHLPYRFILRDYQKPFYRAMRNDCRRAVLLWHRRSGKDKCAWNWIIESAIERQGNYYYFFPTFSQARKVIWDARDIAKFRFLDHVPPEYIHKANNHEMKITLTNGSIIQMIGTDKYNSIMGTNPIGCVFSEYALQDPEVWNYVRPILDVNGGWAVFIFTPRGMNHAYDIYNVAVNNNNWFASKVTVEDTKIFTPEQIKRMKDEEGYSDDYIQQEYYCSFTLGLQGAYYTNYIENCRRDGRITNVQVDPHLEVHTAWDRGYSSAAITFFQLVSKEIHIIDHYESHNESLKDHLKMLKSKPYIYGSHYVPHDMDSHEYSLGMSAREVARDLGIEFTVLPREASLAAEEGIEAARSLFPRLWFDEKNTKLLIRSLENYKREYDEKHRIFKSKPLHNWASHSADSFRYMAQAIKGLIHDSQPITDDWTDYMRKKHNPRFD